MSSKFPEVGEYWLDKQTGNRAYVIYVFDWFDIPYTIFSHELSPPIIIPTDYMLAYFVEATDAVEIDDMEFGDVTDKFEQGLYTVEEIRSKLRNDGTDGSWAGD